MMVVLARKWNFAAKLTSLTANEQLASFVRTLRPSGSFIFPPCALLAEHFVPNFRSVIPLTDPVFNLFPVLSIVPISVTFPLTCSLSYVRAAQILCSPNFASFVTVSFDATTTFYGKRVSSSPDVRAIFSTRRVASPDISFVA
jgi:hypothetical protein